MTGYAMGRKILPSASGLPDDWDKEVELRLGYLEAQDEAREPKIIIKVLKREFPKLSRVIGYSLVSCVTNERKLTIRFFSQDVISAETLVRWIDWLDRQDGSRGEHYRAGLAAGQVQVLRSLKAKGFELEPVSFNRHSTTHHNKRTESPTKEGVRLVEREASVDDEIRAAAGGLEFIIRDTSPTTTPRITASTSQQSTRDTLIGSDPQSSAGSTPLKPVSRNSPGSVSGHRQASYNAQLTPHLGSFESHASSDSPETHIKIGSTTPVSAYFPGSLTNTSFPSSPNTPLSISQQHQSHPHAPGQSPRRSKSAKEISSGGTAITRSATVATTTDKPVGTRNGLGISKPISSQGLRERRQMGELSVGTIAPSRSIQALPAITGRENRKPPYTPSGNSMTSIGLRARVMARWNRT